MLAVDVVRSELLVYSAVLEAFIDKQQSSAVDFRVSRFWFANAEVRFVLEDYELSNSRVYN